MDETFLDMSDTSYCVIFSVLGRVNSSTQISSSLQGYVFLQLICTLLY